MKMLRILMEYLSVSSESVKDEDRRNACNKNKVNSEIQQPQALGIHNDDRNTLNQNNINFKTRSNEFGSDHYETLKLSIIKELKILVKRSMVRRLLY